MAVAEGRAATRLYIAQPSMSHRIRKLEETLGTPLSVRSSRRVQLTAAGRTVAREAPVALAALKQAVQLTRLAWAGIATTIRLGYTPVTGFDTLTTLLDALREDHPEFMVDPREFQRRDTRTPPCRRPGHRSRPLTAAPQRGRWRNPPQRARFRTPQHSPPPR
ncbi:LysR family transcriptional regulator [Nocardia sp. NPDC058499]|uniref:LysR family transcriptional regulator n=1 Tax=Nocardia sp. NPDC058499 TaxID=3346530 RepID=UPI00365C97AE